MLTGRKKRAEALISNAQFELIAKSIGLLFSKATQEWDRPPDRVVGWLTGPGG